ncbi:transcription termination factor Rho [Cellulomonas sp. ES6]|uniref:transcription termination factor Rho n=1 Tax=Cellulomonas sp. ES6 TaxID=3039384 RepID=UPI0024B7A58A|nr:transcription termination factor Rho [Cellulomonas sp. ES6]WHP18570.1 transcription termination factor Rho [Cellulomonas sp. ES6]
MTDTIEPAVSTSSGGSARGGAISAMRMPELQALAAQLGVTGTSRMRKTDLVDAIQAKRSGAGTGKGAGAENGAAAEPRARRAASRAAGRPAAAADPAGDAPSASTPVADAPPAPTGRAGTAPAEAPVVDGDTRRRDGSRRPVRAQGEQRAEGEDAPGQRPGRAVDVLAGLEAVERSLDSRQGAQQHDVRDDRAVRAADAVGSVTGERRSRRAGRGAGAPAVDVTLPEGPTGDGQRQRPQQEQQGDQDRARSDRQQDQGDDDERGGRRRRSRDRYRDRDRTKRGRGQRGPGDAAYEEVELSEDDVLVPVAGILDVLESYAFVRTSGYLPGPNDVYLPLGQVRKAGLRRGDAITGAVRAPREGEAPAQQQPGRPNKANALVRLDTVNGMAPEQARQRPEFSKLTPLYPQDRLRLENESNHLTPRVIDIVAPIGKGQRGLIVAPPKAGKTIIMQQIANAITANNPEVHLMVVLVDERPEEVTDMERTVKGEVIASTFDRPASDHTMVAELAIERAKRLVELGQDVVVLLDSLTRLSRAYNLAAPASGRILSGGVDASALYPPKRFFGAARNIEHGGSLTILASALVETGSKMDEVIFEEFKGTGNMELRLSRSLADKRIFPAVDVNASGTRREEILIAPDELKIIWKLRRVMGALDQQQAIELLLGKLRETRSNVEFLLQVQKTTPGVGAHGHDEAQTRSIV